MHEYKGHNYTTTAVGTCIHPQCTATSKRKKIIQRLQLSATTEGPCSMCRRHFDAFYSHLLFPFICSSYGAWLKRGRWLSQHTPNAHLITKHLSEATGTTGTLPIDYICYRCYRPHLSIMKDNNSSDEALQKDILT